MSTGQRRGERAWKNTVREAVRPVPVLLQCFPVSCKQAGFIFLFSVFSAFPQELRVSSGITDDQVLQRNTTQTADLHLAGSASGKRVNGRAVEARLLSADGAPVSGFDWTPISKVQKLKWTGELKGLPTGGPYRLELRLAESDSITTVSRILVGDLWVLAGQSNMEGHGDLIDVQQPSPLVHSFDLADRWLMAQEPLHTLVNAADPVHWPLNAEKVPERWSGEKLDAYLANRRKGAGLGLPFAVEMLKRTGVPVGLIPCAHGGTSMDQWDPALRDQGGESLYGSMLRRFHAAGGSVRGVLWYQGESDANPRAAGAFRQKFENFVSAVRADFKEPDMPFYYVQIGRHVSGTNVSEWNAVQADQLRAESEIPHSGLVAAVDLSLEDGIHVATQDLKRIAERLANLVCRDLFPRLQNYGELKSGPRPVSAKLADGVLKVSFSGVNVQLLSDGRISGFSIHGPDGRPVPAIYKARIDPAEASTVMLYVQGPLPEKATLWYGYGKDPYCNVHDAEDMPVPAFGPMRID